MTKEEKAIQIIKDFFKKHDIDCAETIYQTDKVIENAYEFIEDLGNALGLIE